MSNTARCPFCGTALGLHLAREDPTVEDVRIDNFLATSMNGLSTRVRNALADEGIKTMGQLMAPTQSELLRIPNFGRKGLAQVETLCAEWRASRGYGNGA